MKMPKKYWKSTFKCWWIDVAYAVGKTLEEWLRIKITEKNKNKVVEKRRSRIIEGKLKEIRQQVARIGN